MLVLEIRLNMGKRMTRKDLKCEHWKPDEFLYITSVIRTAQKTVFYETSARSFALSLDSSRTSFDLPKNSPYESYQTLYR